MIKIGICEDESIWRNHIEEVMNKFFIKKGEPFLLKSYSGGEGLLCGYEGLDLVFLDIEMPGLDGIETAKRIRRLDKNVEIVFLTSHLEFMQEAFQVKAYRFLDKSFNYESIEKCLENFFNDRKLFFKIGININGKEININTKDIIMLEATKNGSIIYHKSKELFCRKSLNDWETIIDNSLFFRCHKSFIVNLNCIRAINEKIKLVEDYEAEISRRRKKSLENKYFDFMEVFAR